MAGRGRGVLLNDLLQGKKITSQSATAPSYPAGELERLENADEKHNTANVAGKRPINNPTSSWGRGLMKPIQFMKKSPANEQKTSALVSAEEYLKATVLKSAEDPAKRLSSAPQELKETPSFKAPNVTHTKQLPSPTSEEKAEADAEWQRYKFQRQILGVLSNVSSENIDDVFAELRFNIDECTLSTKYPQFSETELVLESLIDKSTQLESFIKISNQLVKKVAEHDVMQFEIMFPSLISRKTSEYIHVIASNKILSPRAKSFCMLLGTIFKSFFELNFDRLVRVISSCLQECIEQWTYPDGIGSEVEGFNINKAETHAHAAMELFAAMELQNLGKDRIDELMTNLAHIISLIKESVLNDFLPRKIREVYLGILLAFTPRFQFPALTDDDVKTVVSNSDIPACSLSESMENSDSDVRTKEPSLSSHITYTQHTAKTVWASSDERNAGSEADGKVEETIKNDCNSEFDDADSSVIVESIEEDQNNIEGSSRVDEDDNGGGAERDKGVFDSEKSEAIALTGDGFGERSREKGPYDNIRKMLSDLKLENQLYRFEDSVIRDTVLEADKDTLKGILKEASFPAGVIYEILLFLDKSRVEKQVTRCKETALEGNTAIESFASSQSRFTPVARNAKQQERETGGVKHPTSGTKKRLLGIGRSANKSDDRYRQWARQRAAPWRNDNGFGNHREHLAEDASNWHSRGPAGRGQNLSIGKEKRAISTRYYESAGYEQVKGDSPGTRQIGKVEPIQRTSMGAVDGGELEKVTTSVGGLGFGSTPRACLKCGKKGHMSHECNDIESIFI